MTRSRTAPRTARIPRTSPARAALALAAAAAVTALAGATAPGAYPAASGPGQHPAAAPAAHDGPAVLQGDNHIADRPAASGGVPAGPAGARTA
ncbi:hypothetical protein NPS70_22575 [Streptomyces sp. C10-9-1]|uniref:hypothetical protein n=1 Tax=Streptomyces sp. C10-9-1 TaxID=1859285 RepID=UPI00211319C3|nr:hypothetical protein [Streptomyces sp. C10-9-1]MCQ6555957.1 hypothetical protein [Streptomyces sp. C10-9-1]